MVVVVVVVASSSNLQLAAAAVGAVAEERGGARGGLVSAVDIEQVNIFPRTTQGHKDHTGIVSPIPRFA